MPKQPEAKLVQQLKEAIISRGGRPFKIVASEHSFQEIGLPDLLWCFRGRFVATEVKLPGEPLRAAQRLVLREIYDADGVASVIESREQLLVLFELITAERGRRRGVCFDRGYLSVGFQMR